MVVSAATGSCLLCSEGRIISCVWKTQDLGVCIAIERGAELRTGRRVFKLTNYLKAQRSAAREVSPIRRKRPFLCQPQHFFLELFAVHIDLAVSQLNVNHFM